MQVLTDGFKSLKSIIKQGTPQPKTEGLKKASIISVCSQKGGVGKTTTAVNLAHTLACYHAKEVLLIDLDPQGHVESSLTSLVPDGQRYRPMSSVLIEKKPDLLESVVKTNLPGFHITPGDKSLIETESILTTKIGKEFILREALRMASTHYDTIIIDCPPNLGNLTLNALVSSHYSIVPCELSTLSLEGVSDIFETIDTINERLNKKLIVLGILLTRVDARNQTMNQAVRDQLSKHLKDYLFQSQIAVNTTLSKAQMNGKPILIFDPDSTGARNYKELSAEVLQKIEELRPR